MEFLTTLRDTPLPTILVVGGMFFLVLAVVSQMGGKIEVPPKRQKIAGTFGIVLLTVGIALYFVPPTQATEVPTQDSSSVTVEPTDILLSTSIPLSPTPIADYAITREVSIDLGKTNEERGLMQFDAPNGFTAPASIGGKEARVSTPNPITEDNPSGVHYIYFIVNRDFVFAEETGVYITVEYFDQGDFDFEIQYDSTDVNADEEGVYKGASLMVSSTGSGQWKTTNFNLPDAYFGERQVGGIDFRIAVYGDNDLYVNTITVTKY